MIQACWKVCIRWLIDEDVLKGRSLGNGLYKPARRLSLSWSTAGAHLAFSNHASSNHLRPGHLASRPLASPSRLPRLQPSFFRPRGYTVDAFKQNKDLPLAPRPSPRPNPQFLMAEDSRIAQDPQPTSQARAASKRPLRHVARVAHGPLQAGPRSGPCVWKGFYCI